MEAVETERKFLADHLATWAPVALHAASVCADGGVYAAVLSAATEFLGEEFDRLRPAPEMGGELEVEPLPLSLGRARLARLLLAPATCGAWLSQSVIRDAARALGAPWRPSDTRSALRFIIDDADDTSSLAIILDPLIAELVESATWHHRDAANAPGNAANARRWAATALVMHDRLRQISLAGLRRHHAQSSETITVTGADGAELADIIDRLVVELRGRGLAVERHVEIDNSTYPAKLAIV